MIQSPLTLVWSAITATVAAVTVWVWSEPVTRTVTTNDSGELTITYAATSDVPDLYGDDGITFGEPILRITPVTLDVITTWSGPIPVDSRLVLDMEVVSSQGWRRHLTTPRSLELDDDERTLTAPLELEGAWDVIDSVAELGATSSTSQVIISAELHRRNDVLGHARLVFDITSTVATPTDPPVSGGPGKSVDRPVVDPVTIDTDVRQVDEMRHLSLGPLAVPRSLARMTMITATSAAVAGTGSAMVLTRRRRRSSPAEDAAVRFGRTMVKACAVTGSPPCVVELGDIDELVRVARHLALPLIAVQGIDAVTHQVIDAHVVYLFRASTSRSGSTTGATAK